MNCSSPKLLCPWDFLGKNTVVGCHFLLPGTSRRRDQTHVSCLSGRFLTTEQPGKPSCIVFALLFFFFFNHVCLVILFSLLCSSLGTLLWSCLWFSFDSNWLIPFLVFFAHLVTLLYLVFFGLFWFHLCVCVLLFLFSV